jgi:hypothetical protein
MSLAQVVSASATRALNTYGVAATLSRANAGNFDPTSGGVALSPPSSYPVKVLIDPASLRTLGYKFADSSLIQSGDVLATISAKGIPFDPMPGDTLTTATTVFVVIISRPIYVGASAVIHEMVVRK